MLPYGFYEQIISKDLEKKLKEDTYYIERDNINKLDTSHILSQYIAEIVKEQLDKFEQDQNSIEKQIGLANNILKDIQKYSQERNKDISIINKNNILLTVLDKINNINEVNNNNNKLIRPNISLAKSELSTGSAREEQLHTKLIKEIETSDSIDIIISFIKNSGLKLLINALEKFTKDNKKIRIITTSYLGATDIQAIVKLNQLQNVEIKINYNTKNTRLHAKAYIFHRNSGFTTAYIGSSNISHAALTEGLEWNMKITKKELSHSIDDIIKIFNIYWESDEFQTYQDKDYNILKNALENEKNNTSKTYKFNFIDIRPYDYQKAILDNILAERILRNNYKNLIVAATGTGKTVIAAFDYKRFCESNPYSNNRLLFIAHRQEILKQGLHTFKQILNNFNFGELFVGSYTPRSIDHLFISIQILNSKEFLKKTSSDFYDYIVIDETHHISAESYKGVINYYKPKVLLGLTATPEREDNKNILEYFNNKITDEIRLPDAIEQKLLCPFMYYGVTDNIDLSNVKWTKNGYNQKELSDIYTMDHIAAYTRANIILNSLSKYLDDPYSVKALCFCVSVQHAKFMNKFFNDNGLASMLITGESNDKDRNQVKQYLKEKKINYIFTVDVFNEGVDIPEIDTVLFLRPTESLTIFLQQLGRGLRINKNKEYLTVLDYIGNAHKKFNFENRFKALLCENRNIENEIENNFISLPKGCTIHLEKHAQDYVLENIRANYNNKSNLISRIKTFQQDSNMELNLSNFLTFYNLNPAYIYKSTTFYQLCNYANVIDNYDIDTYQDIKHSKHRLILSKLMYVNSKSLIDFTKKLLTRKLTNLTILEKRMLQQIYITLFEDIKGDFTTKFLLNKIETIKENKYLCKEILELLEFNYNHIDIISEKIELNNEYPLDIHCNYSRDQILATFDNMRPSTSREGVKYLEDKKIDILFITLVKSEKYYSSTTMYDDYSITDKIFHWQSQNATTELSPTGKRYINHKKEGSKVLLFVREYKYNTEANNITAPYTFLGNAQYSSHTGNKPMNIEWVLDIPIPAKYLQVTKRIKNI